MWLTRGKYGIYVVVTGTFILRGLRDAFWKVERNFKMFKIQPYLLSCLLRGGNKDTLVSAA